MSFMRKNIYRADAYSVETNHGIEIVPVDVVGDKATAFDLKDFVEGSEIVDFERCNDKVLANMTAPGYMDSTELCMFDTEKEAEEYLDDLYGEDY